jgi:hypothetical protein
MPCSYGSGTAVRSLSRRYVHRPSGHGDDRRDKSCRNNLKATKLEHEAVSDAAATKKINHIADKAAEKASKVEQNYDENHAIFSK